MLVVRAGTHLDLLTGQSGYQCLGAIGFGWVCHAVAKAGESPIESFFEYWKMRGAQSWVQWVRRQHQPGISHIILEKLFR